MTAHALLAQAETPAIAATSSGGRAAAAVAAALVAYAAGDAFGVAYEFLPDAGPVDTGRISPRDGWPLGGVSDDTLLSLLTIHSITPGAPERSAEAFLTALRREAPRLRGLGPTTRTALGMHVAPDEKHWVGNSNGGMMRTALVGLAYPAGAAAARREMVRALAAATHRDPGAILCAVLASRLFSDALSDDEPAASPAQALEALRDEAAALLAWMPQAGQVVESIASWAPAADGVSLTPADTLGAVVHVADHSGTCLEAYKAACELGGDTDTVCALAAALVAARDPRRCALEGISWLEDVCWDEISHAGSAVAALVSLRAGSEEQ